MSFGFNMCNPGKKKMQIHVWGLLVSTSDSHCLFRNMVRGLLWTNKEHLCGGAKLDYGNWGAATEVLGSCWYRDHSGSGWAWRGSSANSPRAVPTQPLLLEDVGGLLSIFILGPLLQSLINLTSASVLLVCKKATALVISPILAFSFLNAAINTTGRDLE